MPTLSEIVNYLNDLLKVKEIRDFCPNGLQLESEHKEIKKIAVAVSCSKEAIEHAIEEKVDLLLVHHGLFWDKDSHVITGVKRDKIKALLDNQISLLAYHLPLDCNPEYGNNYVAAQKMGFKNLKGFGQSVGPYPIGVMGEFDEIAIEDFQKKLEDFYEHPAACALGGNKTVKSAAIISGGAHREIKDAIAAEVDCFITGSFDEPIWQIAHEEKINFFAMGHFNTETVGVKALGEHLSEKFKLQTCYLDLKNPF